MSRIRLATDGGLPPQSPCVTCGSTGCHWDRLDGRPVWPDGRRGRPDCTARLLRGEADALRIRREHSSCAVCSQAGTVRYLTLPLHESEPVEIDLCPAHLRDLMSRRLSCRAFQRLRRQLN